MATDQPGAGLDWYWCASPTEELPARLNRAWNRYLEYVQQSGFLERWQHAHNLFFGRSDDPTMSSDRVGYGGQQGETVLVRSNQFRSLLEHTHVLITGTRPTLQARGINASATSQTAARMAEQVFEYYLEEHKLERAMQEADRFALRYGEGWVLVTWDPEAGEPVDVEQVEDESTGELVDRVIYQGDITARAVMPLDVIRDPSHDASVEDEDWLAVHTRVSRWDLLAQYPDAAEAIRNAPAAPQLTVDLFSREDREQPDRISALEFYHARTPAMPQGRFAMVVGDTVLFDGPLPYDVIPCMAMRPDIETKTAFGYTTAWDLMGLQDVLDSVVSAIATCHDAGALRNVWTPRGSGLDTKELSNGMTHWESTAKPELVDLMPDLGPSMKFAEMLGEYMSSISGINDVARGQPDANVKSGAMAALIHSMAVQYNSGLQSAYAMLYERIGTHWLDCARRYMTKPRLVAVAGPRGGAWVRDFRGQDVAGIRRIAVDTGNAIMRTSSGRMDIADKFLERQVFQRPEQYLQMLSTGRYEPLLDRPDTKLRGILSENDLLCQGKPARVLLTDHHADHIEAHFALLDEPENRENEELTSVVLDHIQLHIEMWQELTATNPGMLGLIGLPPWPAGGAVAPPDAGGAPMPGGSPGDGGLQGPPQDVAQDPLAAQAGVNMPNMPKVPGQEAPYDPQAGQGI